MTVYVVQDTLRMNREGNVLESKFDFSAAWLYGNVEFLLSTGIKPFKPAQAIRELHAKLKNFTGEDFLLLSGDPVFLGLATAIAASYNEGCINLLKWSGKQKCYEPIYAVNIFFDHSELNGPNKGQLVGEG